MDELEFDESSGGEPEEPPVAYLIDEAGVVARDVVVGVEPILDLMADMNNQSNANELTMR